MQHSFEEFLSEKCPTQTNNSNEGFERWLEQLDIQELMDYAELFGSKEYQRGVSDMKQEALEVIKQ